MVGYPLPFIALRSGGVPCSCDLCQLAVMVMFAKHPIESWNEVCGRLAMDARAHGRWRVKMVEWSVCDQGKVLIREWFTRSERDRAAQPSAPATS